MTDTITAEEYRTAAKVLLSEAFSKACGGYAAEASWCGKEADRLEAEAARDEEAERLAEVYRVAFKAASAGNAPNSWAVAGIRAVLDQLAADGRLLPEGGTVLTEEQAEDVRWLLGLLSDMSFTADRENESYKRLVALFTPPAVSVPDSGPDGTPEKPWPTWQDVPEGVRYTDQADPNAVDGWWVNRGGQRFSVNRRDGHEFASALSDSKMQRLAPFVRVDGDKA
ncbi:hypothetical protein GS500_04620 [Rhodococcus hoagii]|nr:hypothetical protein [Prescottella equi]